MDRIKCDFCNKEYDVDEIFHFGGKFFCEKCEKGFREEMDDYDLRVLERRRGKKWIKDKLKIK